MQKLLVSMVAVQFAVAAAVAQPSATSAPSLSLDQQNKISEIITNKTAQPLTNINFALERDGLVPSDVALQRLPAEAEKIAPQLQGYSYLAVEELVAIVDTDSRKIVIVMQRVRRPENTGSGN